MPVQSHKLPCFSPIVFPSSSRTVLLDIEKKTQPNQNKKIPSKNHSSHNKNNFMLPKLNASV